MNTMKTDKRRNMRLFTAATFVVLALLYLGAVIVWDGVIADRFDSTRAKAEAGDAEAQLVLGMMYEKGVGTEASLEQALQWYMKSVEGGNTNARSVFCAQDEAGQHRYPLSEEQVRQWCLAD